MAITKVSLAADTWVNIGTGPVTIQARQPRSIVLIGAGASQPTDDDAAFLIGPGVDTTTYTTSGSSDTLWAKSLNGSTTIVKGS